MQNPVSAQGGCHSKSLRDSKFTTHSKFATVVYSQHDRVLWVFYLNLRSFYLMFRVRKIQPKVFLHKVLPNPGRPDPNPGTSRPLPV